jgi:uncharacterized protein YeeX (DUF496 family)
MIDISYKSDDPGVCYETLRAIGIAFLARYKTLKGDESRSALNYFQKQLDNAYGKLQESENNLKLFISENKILNYYEQGKSLDLYKKEIEQQEQNAQQIVAGADASLNKLEKKLASGREHYGTVDSLYKLRETVSQLRMLLNSYLIEKELHAKEISDLRKQIADINDRISGKVSQMHNSDFSIDGISSTILLQEWLNLYIEREKQLNAIETILSSKKYVDRRIDTFAPLGAELNKREREVKVNEGQYLSILHGLNLANLQMQSLEMSNAQEIIDEPYYPNSPKSSTRILLVMVSYLLGHIILLGILLAGILLDMSLREAENATAITGLRTVASFPEMKRKKSTTGLTALSDLVATQLSSELLVARNNASNPAPFKVCIYQTLSTDGGELLATVIQEKLTELKVNAKSWIPDSDLTGPGIISYQVNSEFAVFADWGRLNASGDGVTNEVVICVLPFLKENALPAHLIQRADLVLLSISAKRQWKPFDRQSLDMIKTSADKPVWLVLNHVDPDNLKDYFGYIPVKSWIGRDRKLYI